MLSSEKQSTDTSPIKQQIIRSPNHESAAPESSKILAEREPDDAEMVHDDYDPGSQGAQGFIF